MTDRIFNQLSKVKLSILRYLKRQLQDGNLTPTDYTSRVEKVEYLFEELFKLIN